MARKKHAEEHENLERWLVSYADFITLLFATFVVLYALSQLDLAKFKEFKSALQIAFSASPTVLKGEPSILDNRNNSILSTGGQQDNQNLIPPIVAEVYNKKEKADFEEATKAINKDKIKDLGKGVDASVTERGLVIKLLGNIVFESSSATIKKESYKTLDEIGKMVKTKFPNHMIRIEGHTDNQAIMSVFYPSNWELSSARASSIARYLIDKSGIAKDRFSVLGYSDSKPIASNAKPEGREQNRRVEIVILRNNNLTTEILSDNFKKDLKKEVEKFKAAAEDVKRKDKHKNNDAVEKLVKEESKNGKKARSVIIFDNSSDTYKQDTEKILQQLKLKEKEAEEDAKVKRQAFSQSVRDQFEHKK